MLWPDRGRIQSQAAVWRQYVPDGEWVVFCSDQTDQKLKKVSVRGGPPQILADVEFSASLSLSG